jgi:hypothetical protein
MGRYITTSPLGQAVRMTPKHSLDVAEFERNRHAD